MFPNVSCPCREKEIEQKISRLDVKEGEERGGGGGGGGSAYRPPGARDRAEPTRDDRHRKFHYYPFILFVENLWSFLLTFKTG
jgi:hypothetical protein